MLLDHTRHIGVLSLNLYISQAQSLKDRRIVLNSLRDKLRANFNISFAQLDREDKWQLALCGVVMVGNDRRYIDGCLQKILNFVETYQDLQINDYEINFI